jgi:hypothetical protein
MLSEILEDFDCPIVALDSISVLRHLRCPGRSPYELITLTKASILELGILIYNEVIVTADGEISS